MKTVFYRLCFTLLCVIVAHVSASAAVLNVPADYLTIQDAIDASATGDTVRVADGTYSGDGFVCLDPGGKEITIESVNGSEYCQLDAMDEDRFFHIHSSEGNTLIIRGFTFNNGFSRDSGGAVLCEYVSPTIDQCVFNNCHGNVGGAVYLNGCSAVVFNCEFSGNTADENGGGLAVVRSDTSTINNCGFTENSARLAGGAVYSSKGNSEFNTCQITDNHSHHGGGFYCTNQSNLRIIGSAFMTNQATSGGAMFNSFSIDQLNGTRFENNTAYEMGGAIFSGAYSVYTATLCDFVGNTACNGGCFAISTGSVPAIDQCICNGNKAIDQGGAVYLIRGGYRYGTPTQPEFTANSFINNIAGYKGGAFSFIHIDYASEYQTLVDGNTFSGNIAPVGSDLSSSDRIYLGTIAATVSNNTFQGHKDLGYYIHKEETLDFQNNTFNLTPVDADLYVKSDGDDSSDGLSWATAFKTIQHALSVVDTRSSAEKTIYVADGTYSPSTTNEIFPLPLLSGITIHGSDMNNVIIDAEETGSVFSGAAMNGVAIIENVAITGGKNNKGGGVSVMDGAVVINGCRINDNKTVNSYGKIFDGYDPPVEGGGGIYVWNDYTTGTSTLLVTNSEILNNHSHMFGGGVYNNGNCDVIIGGSEGNGNTISGNTAGFGLGASIAVVNSPLNPNLTWNEFEFNFDKDSIVWTSNFCNLENSTYQKDQINSGHIYVSPTGSNENSGHSATEPFQTLQHALKACAYSGVSTTVHIASGTYSADSNSERFPLPVHHSLQLIGDETDLPIIDPNGVDRGIVGLEFTDSDLSHLKIINGFARQGGGIYLYGGNGIINNLEITGNTALYSGGGMDCSGYGGSINNSLFSQNQSYLTGGGLHAPSTALSFSHLTFEQNDSWFGGGATIGGELYSMEDCIARNNTAVYGGGLSLTGSLGGSLYHCLIEQNHSSTGGGLFLNGSPDLESIIIKDNTANWVGGGVASEGPYVAEGYYNCLITGNSASVAGAISFLNFQSVTTIEIFNSTIVDNHVEEFAGGILPSYSSQTFIKNSIVYNNSHEQIVDEGLLNVEYSNIQNGWTGTGNIDSDPLFTSCFNGDYYLSQTASGQSQDSPCLNSGSTLASDINFTNFAMSELTTRTDQILDSDTVDMGYHYDYAKFPPTPTPTVTPEPTNTPEPTPTPNLQTGVDIELSHDIFIPGETIHVGVWVTNGGAEHLTTPLFVILNVYGDLFFAPDFDDFSYYDYTYPPGQTYVSVIPETVWPDTGTSADGLIFVAGLTDPEISMLLGELDMVTFGYR